MFYMTHLPSTTVRSIQLDILSDINSFCLANNIRYCLAYGTAIGAIRHNGFIPWDDDIDIMMLRPDYDAFIKTYNSAENEVIDLAKSSLCVEMFAKVCRKGTRIIDTYGRALWGINVDIFPIDGLPNDNALSFYERMCTANSHIPIVCPFYKTVSHKKMLWFTKYLLKRSRYFYYPSTLKIKSSITDSLRSVQIQDNGLAGAFFGDAGYKEFMPSSVFKESILVSFEGGLYPIPKDYHTYLTSLYGDYMTLPPEDQRMPHHLYQYYYD